ncbi:CvpA family protein [Oceanicella sp. SM1341]|uniref:CvpA family protein n=1 Tax=Oceanicella sp. SM1341 TaxID=1548889 RepID=UPI000E55284A|nr:CvpA family protein [Oceanicella sp. SM1341]
MDGFTIADGVVLLVIAVSALLAYSRGFVREVLAIAGWVIAAIVAFYLAPTVEPLVREIPVITDFLSSSCQFSVLAAFAVVFAVALIILSIFTPLFASWVQNSALGPVDQGAGFLFGLARGVLLVVVALVVYQYLNLDFPQIDNSRTAVFLADARDQLRAEVPTETPGWLDTRYEQLFGTCSQ